MMQQCIFDWLFLLSHVNGGTEKIGQKRFIRRLLLFDLLPDNRNRGIIAQSDNITW
jgi:hypothetical protein